MARIGHPHIALLAVDPLPPLHDDIACAGVGCSYCAGRAAAEEAAHTASVALQDVTHALRGLQEQMLATQHAAREVFLEQKRVVAALKEPAGRHPRCAVCRVFVGPGHPGYEQLVREPYGEERVCRVCYRTLDTEHRTAAAQLRANWEADREEAAR